LISVGSLGLKLATQAQNLHIDAAIEDFLIGSVSPDFTVTRGMGAPVERVTSVTQFLKSEFLP